MPFHNQAVNELHETDINCGLEQVVSRLFHFQLVELSNLLAYLENVCLVCSNFDQTRKSKMVHDTLLATIVTDLVKNT